MEKKINIAELLKDCPKGMELDCTMYEGAELDCVTNDKKYPIKITIKDDIDWDITMSLTKEGWYNTLHNPKCIIFPKGKTTWEGFVPPYKFKDGDVIYNQVIKATAIFHKQTSDNTISHCFLNVNKELKICHYHSKSLFDWRLATEEEKAKLFQSIKDHGYKWKTESKTLEKLVKPKFKVGDRVRHKETNKDDVYEIIKVYGDSYGLVGFTWMIYMKYQDQYELVPNKFDITTLKPFDKVLVRGNVGQKWVVDFFGFMDNDKGFPFVCVGHYVCQCIPYEGNEHLLGKTDDCDNFYKTWE